MAWGVGGKERNKKKNKKAALTHTHPPPNLKGEDKREYTLIFMPCDNTVLTSTTWTMISSTPSVLRSKHIHTRILFTESKQEQSKF